MTDQVEGLKIALEFAQRQRNEQAEVVINVATSLELANRKIALLEAEIKQLRSDSTSENPPNGSVNV